MLEVANAQGKGTTDSPPCTLRALLHEFEEATIVDTTIMGHSCDRPDHDSPSVTFLLRKNNFPVFNFKAYFKLSFSMSFICGVFTLPVRRRLLRHQAGGPSDVQLHPGHPAEHEVLVHGISFPP